jgi:hypothetical protein
MRAAVCLLACAQMTKADFRMGTPTPVPNVNSSSHESVPDISADGLELYFSSNRPYGADLCYSDLWVARRTSRDDPWGTPMNLGTTVNSPTYDLGPTISTDGLELYLSDGPPFWYTTCVPRPGGYGNGDLWVSKRETTQGDWGSPVNLGSVVNSPNWDGGPGLAPDGLSLFFISDRPGGYGRSDLYVTTRHSKDDPWGPPVNLGLPVNGARWQTSADISADGLSLFITAGTEQLDMFVSRRATTADAWGTPVSLGPALNTPKDEYGPTLSADGSILYFTRGELAHPYPNPELATFDIWQVEVIPIVDFNGNGKVDIKDLLRLIESWRKEDPSVDIAPLPLGDRIVDEKDLEVLMSYWGQEVNDPTLTAGWKLDESEGSVAHDITRMCDGTLQGDPVWQPQGGKIGGALLLDGTDDFISTAFVLNPTAGPFSVFAWVKGGLPGQVILSQQEGVNWLLADASDGALATDLKGGRSAKPLKSSVNVADDQWHRVGFTWDGSNRTLCVDDIQVSHDTQVGLWPATGGLQIGAASTLAPGTFWRGLIDDVRIYDRAIQP